MSESSTKEKSPIDTFLEGFASIKGPEEKLKSGIAFMRTSLTEGGTPYFKGFWEVRKQCLPLFKEVKMSPERAKLWDEYIELTREGRRLKNLVDEEAAFAIEQIDLAIVDLEKKVAQEEKNLSEVALPECQTLKREKRFFQEAANVLAHLNGLAVKISALRKELIKQPMRIRQKNQFFDRLSKLGDIVFPARKEKIHEVSERFLQEIEGFVQKHFSQESFSRSDARGQVFFLKEEIKALQSLAKLLTLSTAAFTKTREQLSGCWDQLKGLDKEFKKEAALHREKSAANAQEVREKMKAFQEGEISDAEVEKELEKITLFMREVVLTRSDVLALKEELAALRAPFEEKKRIAEEKKREERLAKEKARKQAFLDLKAEVDTLKEPTHLQKNEEKLKNLQEKVKDANLTSQERAELKKTLRRAQESVEEAKEKELLASLSDSDRASIGQLETLLNNREEQKKEIKEKIDALRKKMGGSGQDFLEAMNLSQQMEEEKGRLGDIEKAIEEIENKLDGIKNST